MDLSNTERIAELNDEVRKHPFRATIVLTEGVQALEQADKQQLVGLVSTFNDFNEGNNPHGERDFGAIDFNDVKYFWKIDYYDNSLHGGSEDPSNPNITHRVLTIMRADEY
jgi:hypothetical protein